MRDSRLLLLPIVLGMIGCSNDPGVSRDATLSPTSTRSETALASLTRADRDCLQYRIAKYADGTEDWNADWVYFSLVQMSDSTVARDSTGHPIAVNLLHEQVRRFMRDHPVVPGTGWTYVVKRMKRHVREGRVLSQSGYTIVEDVDLADLIHKDRIARTD